MNQLEEKLLDIFVELSTAKQAGTLRAIGPYADRAINVLRDVVSEYKADVQRLEVLMQHPDKLFIDGSGDKRLYSGADDGTDARGRWHSDPRKAVDDITQRLKIEAAANEEEGD